MADRAQFQKKLGELLAVAASQNNKMTSQEVQAFFQDDNLTDEQMNLVHEFLMSQKVEVIGYTGTIENTEKTEQEEKDTLSQQEKDYVAEYLIDIEKMAKQTEEEVTLAYYLPKVVEEAVKLHMPGIFIGDVIQEGNVSLMQALSEMPEAQDISIMEEVRVGMLALIEAQTEVKRQDKRMVEQVSELDEAIRSMTEELGRKVAVDELAERLGIGEEQIAEILKLAGEDVDN